MFINKLSKWCWNVYTTLLQNESAEFHLLFKETVSAKSELLFQVNWILVTLQINLIGLNCDVCSGKKNFFKGKINGQDSGQVKIGCSILATLSQLG